MPRSQQSGYSVLPLTRPHSDERIKRVEDYLQQHFAGGASVDALAASAGMSRRNFIRRFKNATGRVPGAYIQMLRLCARVGYEDTALFRDLFKRHTGMTPANTEPASRG